ncbi:asparagine synthase-related protein [Sphingomonas oryzagri]
MNAAPPVGTDWTCVLSAGATRIYAAPRSQYLALPDGLGILFGTAFVKSAGYRSANATDLSRLLHEPAPAEWLAANFWGSFVVFAVDRASDALTVYRDPGGMQPCYHMRADRTWIFAAEALDITGISGERLEIDWPALAAHMLLPDRRLPSTCLQGVCELVAGRAATIRDGAFTSWDAWSPWTFCRRSNLVLREASAVAVVREETLNVMRALCRDLTNPLLGLSGGLDSSIVAASLAAIGQPFTALTLCTTGRSGDERDYARLVTGYLGATLYEREERIDLVDLARSDSAHLPRPVSRAFAQSGDHHSRSVAAEAGTDAFFSGGGGDNVFCNIQSVMPVADRIRSGSNPLAIVAAANDVAAIADCKTFTVLYRGIQRAFRRPLEYRWRGANRFLSSRTVDLAIADRHPWQDPPTRFLPGQSNHIIWLLGIQNHLEGHGREREHRFQFPLLAQPLVEACLRIPSWLWCTGGRNRSVARRAFADLLPQSIIARRSKGTPDSFVADLLDVHRENIREMLGDGILRREGMIEFGTIDDLLRRPSLLAAGDTPRIMALVDVEAWLRAWRGHSSMRQPRPRIAPELP